MKALNSFPAVKDNLDIMSKTNATAFMSILQPYDSDPIHSQGQCQKTKLQTFVMKKHTLQTFVMKKRTLQTSVMTKSAHY